MPTLKLSVAESFLPVIYALNPSRFGHKTVFIIINFQKECKNYFGNFWGSSEILLESESKNVISI